MSFLYYEKKAGHPYYIDLRPIADDKRIVKNPHKGWYMHYIDNGMIRPFYRDRLAPGDRLEDFPCMNHLYLRIDWSDVEPEEGKYDWSYLDRIFGEWSEYDVRFSFRLCCYELSNPYATPEWVRLAGAKGTDVDHSGYAKHPNIPVAPSSWEPVYDDPIFLEKLDNFMAAYAAKYDGDPRVEFVDVGTFGTFGEGHTGSGTGMRYSADVLKKHIDIHTRHFKKTTVLMNDDFCNTAFYGGASSMGTNGTESASSLAEYAAGKGLGIRDDSPLVRGCAAAFGYDTLRNPPLFAKFYDTAPVDLETAHFHLNDPAILKEYFPLVDAMRITHATYAGFHGDPRKFQSEYPYFADYAANRLGYWYFMDGIDLPECVSGMKSVAKLYLHNRGWSKAYNPYTLKLRLVGVNGTYPIFEKDGLNLNWQGESDAVETLVLDLLNVPAGEYRLELGLFEGERPIQFAVLPDRIENGWNKLANITVREDTL